MAVDVGSAVGYLDLDISKFLAGLRTAQSEADKQSKNIATKVGNNISGIGKNLTSVGTTLTKNVSVPIIGIGTTIVTMSSNFESAMSKVSAISGATGSDLDKLNEKAQEMGAKTKFSATEAAEAFTYMAMAGWKTEDMLAGIDGIMNLAAADGLDLATTSDIVTDALTAFGLGASDSAHFADVLAKASSSANTNVSMLGESFKYVAPVAGALGYSAEDTAVALGLMANAGIKGSQSGTALRGALTRLIKPTEDAADLMKKYGLSMTNSDGSMKSLGEVMVMLRNNLGDLTEAEQAQVAATLFGQEAMSGMLSIINASDKDFQNLTDQIYSADGAAKQMADTMLDNLSGQLTILKSALEGLALQFGEILLPYLKRFVTWLQNLVQKLQELSPEQKKQIVKWAAFAAAIGPVILVIGKLVTGIGGLITIFGKIPAAITATKAAFTAMSTGLKNIGEGVRLAKAGFPGLGAEASKLGAAIGGITAPIAAVIAAIGLLVAAFVSLWKNNEEFRNSIIAIWTQIKETFSSLVQGIKERLDSLGINFESVTGTIKAIWEGFCNFLAPFFIAAFQLIADTFDIISAVILGALDVFISLFKGDWQGAWDAVKGIFETVWNGISSFLTAAFEIIKTTVSNAMEIVKTKLSTVWEEIKTSTSTVVEDIKTKISTVWENIKTSISTTIDGIRDNLLIKFTSIKTVATTLWDNIKTAIVTPLTNAKNTVIDIISGIKTSISDGFNEAKTTVSNVFETIKTTISGALETAKTTVTNAINAIKELFDIDLKLDIKLPHVKVSGGEAPFGIGGKGKLPSFTVEWYRKAMASGMILNSPTIFGFDSGTGRFLGGGEAGSETVVGTNSLLNMIRQTVNESMRPVIEAAYQIARASTELGYVTYNGFAKQTQVLEKIAVSGGNGSSGDTFIFNSPKPIDEIEAARQMRKTKRDMAEGF